MDVTFLTLKERKHRGGRAGGAFHLAGGSGGRAYGSTSHLGGGLSRVASGGGDIQGGLQRMHRNSQR